MNTADLLVEQLAEVRAELGKLPQEGVSFLDFLRLQWVSHRTPPLAARTPCPPAERGGSTEL